MSQPQVTVLYNPKAGPANMAHIMREIADDWQAEGWQAHIVTTEYAGHATELARISAEAGADVVLAAGGDGTLGEVAAGLAGTPTALGPLPAGTANSFARELHLPLPKLVMPSRLRECARLLRQGQVQEMDLGYSFSPDHPDDGRTWLLWAGVGFDSFLVDKLEPRPKWIKKVGRASYFFESAPHLIDFSPFYGRVTVDGEMFDDDFVLALISNCRRYAGGILTINPDKQLDDGLLDVYLFRGKGLPAMSLHATLALLQELDHHDIVRTSGRRVTIASREPYPYHTDGEPVGVTPFVTEVRPRAIKLLVPTTAPDDLFQASGVPLARRSHMG